MAMYFFILQVVFQMLTEMKMRFMEMNFYY